MPVASDGDSAGLGVPMPWTSNIGFIFDSRWADLAFTLAAILIAAFGVLAHDDLLVAFCIPAVIGIFRQFLAYMTVPFVLSYGIAVLLGLIWLDIPARLGSGA